MTQSAEKIAFGDFQTPCRLADQVVALLRELEITPEIVVEPTCGQGNFVRAAIDGFPSLKQVFGFEIRNDYVASLRQSLEQKGGSKVTVELQDFFVFDWDKFFSSLEGDLLVLGNPPWVTSAVLGRMGVENLPQKSNFQDHSGFSAKTGKANFDISEWMLIKLLDNMHKRKGCIAMLCKLATARKMLRYAWTKDMPVGDCSIHCIDAKEHFGASVDACLLVIPTGEAGGLHRANVYAALNLTHRTTTYGLAGGELAADIDCYDRNKELDGYSHYKWRSGIKHDASAIMELRNRGNVLVNGNGEVVSIEDKYLFPLLKSSDLANDRLSPTRYVLVTQRKPNQDTSVIALDAPRTWAYLNSHADVLDRRPSIVYRKRSRFSVFGVGDYAFSQWKVAISGLYKIPRFRVVGEFGGRPIQVDDTCYFLSCRHREEAEFVHSLLCSEIVSEFLRALIFRDAKRPLTIDVLNRISLVTVAQKLGLGDSSRHFLEGAAFFEGRQHQLLLGRKES